MANRPLLQPTLRIIITPDEQLPELGADLEDNLEGEANRRARQAEDKGVGDIEVEHHRQSNSVIFDLDITQTGYIDIDNLQGEFRAALKEVTGIRSTQSDVTVDAEIRKVFGLRD